MTVVERMNYRATVLWFWDRKARVWRWRKNGKPVKLIKRPSK